LIPPDFKENTSLSNDPNNKAERFVKQTKMKMKRNRVAINWDLKCMFKGNHDFCQEGPTEPKLSVRLMDNKRETKILRKAFGKLA
jgi:hypothetical protein